MIRPLRILQVVGGMNRGGAETWLMHVVRNIDRARYQMDFLVHTREECSYDAELRRFGFRLHYCPSPRNPVRYGFHFRRILLQHGPYDIVHSHLYLFSGYVLALAQMSGVPVRIAHGHTGPSSRGNAVALGLRAYQSACRSAIKLFSTDRIAVSHPAAEALFGSGWQADPDTRILYCGVDPRDFEGNANRESVRADLGIGPDDYVLGHVGRFVPVKNHSFLLQVARRVIAHRPLTRLVLIGDGPLTTAVRDAALTLGISDHVRLLGSRHDVARLLCGAMDAFLFPSEYEGLPLAVVEAQLAGLPVLMSDAITPEVDLGLGLIRRLPLSIGPDQWARNLVELPQRSGSTVPAPSDSVSKFDIVQSARRLCRHYDELAAPHYSALESQLSI